MNRRIQLIIILIIILITISLFQTKETFVYVKNVYGVGGTCNDYIPDYNACPTAVPTFSTDNIENFACPCAARRNRQGITTDTDTINITNQWNG
jgi:hypothetical protein